MAASTAYSDGCDTWNTARWTAEEHPLGRGTFVRSHVRPETGALNLVVAAGSYDGGEIRVR